jgi:dipeptidyl aminopeptidase/acylaminoacyl peptidase
MGCRSVAALILFAAGFAATAAPPPPLEAYAALPGAQDPQISPDGNRLAMIASYKDKPILVVRGLDDKKMAAIETGKTIPDWFFWKNDDTLLASVRFTAYNAISEAMMETRLVFLSPDGKEAVPVRINRDPAGGGLIIGDAGNRVPQFQDHVVSILPQDPDHLLMEITPKEDYLHPDLVRVDVHSGRPFVVQRSKVGVTDWYTDADGRVRAAQQVIRQSTFGKEVHRTILARPNDEAEWQMVQEADIDQGKRLEAAGIGPDGNTLYVMMDGEGGRLIARGFDINSHQWGEVVAADQHCDVVPLYHQRRLNAFVLPCQAKGKHYLDPAWQNDYLLVMRALKTDHVNIEGRSGDGKRTLVSALETLDAPRSFWLLDRRSGKAELKWIGDSYHDIPAEQIAESKPIRYPARDGKLIPAILTLPVGYQSGAIPFVVLPHGGPTANDVLGFDWMVQFLASRGYGVLRPQFRGSSGYGRAWQEAGYQQWGGLMQDDITDGARWLVTEGKAEYGKIAIVGASFGGYAALMQAIREPKLYACAAAFAPVTDLDLLVRQLKHTAFTDLNLPKIVNQGQTLESISPSENADKIEVPVLLMHGDKDFTVPKEHSEEMERALKRKGKHVEAVYLEGADHYFASGTDRLAWLTALDKLLAANLGRPVQQ